MKTVLCYGDSNTYGYNPENGFRYPADVRWPGVLRGLLGPDYTVVEEGCNGRTTVFDDPEEGWKNGLDYLKPCLNSHKPVDVVILMLGSNDLKRCFGASAADIADGAGVLAGTIREFCELKQGFAPAVVLVSPPLIGPGIGSSPFRYAFDGDAIDRSRAFADEYRRVAAEKGCVFFDAASVAVASEADSLHLTAESHRKLAEALAEIVRKL
jgi:lysophospholipase L1-like esterase